MRFGGRCVHVEDPGGSQEIGAGILAPGVAVGMCTPLGRCGPSAGTCQCVPGMGPALNTTSWQRLPAELQAALGKYNFLIAPTWAGSPPPPPKCGPVCMDHS